MRTRLFTIIALAALVAVLGPVTVSALTEPAADSELAPHAFRDADLYVSSAYTPVDELPLAARLARLDDLAVLGVDGEHGFVDRRTGSWGTLLLSAPLVPGDGKANTLDWADLGRPAPASLDQFEAAALDAFEAYLALHQAEIGLPLAELGQRSVTAHGDGDLVQIVIGQSVAGVPVRGAFLTAVVGHGNLVMLGARNWGAVLAPTAPQVDEASAVAAVAAHVGRPIDGLWSEPSLELVPVSTGADPLAQPIGAGLSHKLVWVIGASFDGDNGSWEALVDATSGEMVAFMDANHYVKGVRGGVFPLSNDGIGVEGNEQPGYPMPYADVTLDGGETLFTDSGGDVVCAADGSSITSQLSGRYVSIFDNCGTVSESAADPNDLDFGASAGTDCQTPAGSASPGNTHSARSGFYEVNRIHEIARSWLPDNAWLQAQLTANMNIDDTCNAFWNGSTINFYQSGGGCRNTGEIAAIFDHEWGHGMDDNDANPGISAPGEAYADVAAVLRLNTSCIGRGFEADDSSCRGNGDPCLDCSGVREVDWAKRDSGQPHDIDWILNPSVVGRGGCVDLFIPTQQGPCGLGTHCEGSVASEAVWDLLKRDLPAFAGAGFSFDDATAQEMLHRTYYLAGGVLGNWYNCNPAGQPGERGDGCNADGAYLNFLALDDDNGDLTDGTPHMPAFHAAFDRHQMACDAPTPTVGATCTRPTSAPNVSLTPTNKGVELSWQAVPGAEKYWVFRGDGALACTFGKARVAEVTGTSFVDSGLGHDLAYAYTVMPVGSSDSCIGPVSPCATVTPVPGADLAFTGEPTTTAITGGDGDPFVDNCETATVGFTVTNIGAVALSNVRVTHVEPLSHPSMTITSTPTFAASLPACGEADGNFEVIASGLAYNDEALFRVDVTADELGGRVVSTIARLLATESDFTAVASRTWSFDDDLEDWSVVNGSFSHNDGLGGNGSLGYLESTAFQDDNCDQARSPVVRLSASSTLSLYNQYAIEPGDPDVLTFFDRANVGVVDVANGTRTTVSPDAGRLYNATGANGACVTAGEDGWAGAGVPFDESSWSAAALNPGGAFTGGLVRLDVAYGTDPLVSGSGFQFDEVTLTDFEEQSPDQQTDVCPVTPPPPPPCGDVDDDDAAVDYRRGWHRKSHAAASNGNYHRRMGKANNGTSPTARVTFSGDSVTYHYAMSEIGGVGAVYIDGVFQESISYGNGGNGPDQPTFGHSRTWSGLGAGTHTLVVEHVTGTVYVDGFSFDCDDSGADASAVEYRSETETLQVPASEGPIVLRTVTVGAADEEVSVVVAGSSAPLTVELLDPVGLVLGSGSALLPGGTTSGLDAAVAAPGVYTVRVTRPLGSTGALEMSVARTYATP